MCTRVFNNFNSKFLATARNMDWEVQLPTSLFVFKKGLSKTGTAEPKENALTWTSIYDSSVSMVGAPGIGYGASDGINSEGLVANMLYDSNANYGRPKSDHKLLDVLRWAQYVLDVFSTVEQVVTAFSADAKEKIQLLGSKVPGSPKEASLHLSVSDIKGDSAIIEVVNGGFKIYHHSSYRVMTNEPSYETQLLLNNYWTWQWSSENKFPSHTIPGGPFPSDRFERASFYVNHLKNPTSTEEALAQVKSVVANASVPVAFDCKVTSDSPNVAQTLWSTISDHNGQIYYFANARTPDVMWIALNAIDSLPEVSNLDVVIQDKDDTFDNVAINGLVNDLMKKTNDPFRLVDQTSKEAALSAAI
ncbi:linear amide C-N hydrolase [Litoribrevibacter euphylliae]|uniref:Linear amide C-N hydrolase n=1 Tax=Litoribrevibacter euphylliae TaxID=1834034 RepID=A0ABV7HE22_9GAMM